LLAFAKELEDLFSTSTGLKISPSLVDKLEHHIQNFPLNLGSAAATKYGELDRSGTALWNLSTRLKRNDDLNNTQILTVLAMARLYALLMLDCAHSSGNGAFTNVARVMKVALKTAKNCLGANLSPISTNSSHVSLDQILRGYRPQATRLRSQSVREGGRIRRATQESERTVNT
jgi:hypothetical protein